MSFIDLCPYKMALEEVDWMEDCMSIDQSALVEIIGNDKKQKNEVNHIRKCALRYERYILEEIFSYHDSGYEDIRVFIEYNSTVPKVTTIIVARNRMDIIDFKYDADYTDAMSSNEMIKKLDKLYTCWKYEITSIEHCTFNPQINLANPQELSIEELEWYGYESFTKEISCIRKIVN
jgi:hypothetical protein